MNHSECPIIATDHDSAMVQADWYEENGYQQEADAMRLLDRYSSERIITARAIIAGHTSSCSSKSFTWMTSRQSSRSGRRSKITRSACNMVFRSQSGSRNSRR